MEVTTQKIKDWKWYESLLVKKGEECVGKIHVPIFEQGQILIRFHNEEDIIIHQIDETPSWFQEIYKEETEEYEKTRLARFQKED